ncbi:hypothetical protein OROGR_018800 [Orobanche gracilis]
MRYIMPSSVRNPADQRARSLPASVRQIFQWLLALLQLPSSVRSLRRPTCAISAEQRTQPPPTNVRYQLASHYPALLGRSARNLPAVAYAMPTIAGPCRASSATSGQHGPPSREILKIRDGTPLKTGEILTYIKSPRNGSVCYFSSKFDVPSNVVQKKRVARILFFKIRPSREILKIRDGTPFKAGEILTYIKSPRNRSICYFSRKLDVPSNVVQKKRVARILFFKIRPSREILKIRDVARILFFKIRPSREILKIRDGTPLKTGEILTYIKSPRNGSVCYFSSKFDVPSNVVQKKRVARIMFIKIRPPREILKIRDGTPLKAGEILTHIKSPRNGSVCYFSSKLDVPSNVVQKIRVARILFFKIRPSREILKIRDGTPMEAGEILTYIKSPRNGSICYFSRKLDVPSNVVQKKRVARILFFQIRPSREILKIRDGTPLEAGEILTYIKSPRNGSVCYFSSKLDVPSNVVQKIRVARILFFKIRPSREILKIRDGTPLEAGEILTYIKSPRNGSICYFSRKLDVPSNVVQKKRVAQILFFKIRPSREILKICDGTSLKAGEILTYIKSPRNGSVCYFYSKLYVPSNVVQKKRVAPILFFKIRPSQEILRIRDTPSLEAGEILTYIKKPSKRISGGILTYIKSPRNGSVCYFSSMFDVPSNVVQKKRVARIMFIKIRPSREILKIRDGTPLKAGEILTHIKSPRNGSVCYFSSKLDVPSNVVQKIRVARILFFKIRPSREILKIRDGTPLEAGEILTYIKSPRNESICYFSRKLDVPINVVQKKRVARILFFKIRPSREILKIRDGTPLEAGEILTYIKSPRNGSICYFSRKLDVPSNVVQKKRVAQILFFKIRPSREILKICDGTSLKAGEILTYIKSPRNGSVCYFYSKLYVPSNVVQKKRVAPILFFKIRPSQEILRIRDTPSLEAGEILTYIKKPSKRINAISRNFKIRDGTPLEAGEILTYIKSPRNGSVCYFSSMFDVPSNVVQKKRVARIMFIKIRPSREILKIRDGTPLKAGEILTHIKSPRNGSVCYFSSKLDVPSNVVQKIRVARILFFKIRPSREILKIRDGTPLEAGEILTYIKSPRNGSICYFSRKLDVPSNVVQKKRVARILFFKIRPSREILKIRDGTPLEAGEILTYIKSPRNGSIYYFSRKLDVPSNVVQKKRVARILFFKIRPSREILKIRDGTPLKTGEILTYIKSPRNGSVCYFSSKFDVPSNVVQKKRVARIMFSKIRPSREILKIRDGTPLKAGEILTHIKSPRNGSVCYFSSKLDVPSNVVQKIRVARILFFKIRPSREILKIREGTPLEAGKILTYIKSPRNGSICYFSRKLDVPSNVVQKKRVARILFFKIRPSREILKIRDDVPSNVVQKKRVARILFFKIRPSREILKIRDGTPLKTGEILTYIKSPRNGSVCYFSSKFDVPSNVVQKKRVARILFFKIRPSREILKIRDGTPLEAGEILTYIKSPRNGSICYFSSKLDVPSNVVQKKRVERILFFKIRPSREILKFNKRVARILFFKIRPSREILKIRDGTPFKAGEILTYIKSPRNGSARILFFKIRPSREILKIRDGTPLKAGEILTHIKSPRNGSDCYFSSKLDVPSNVVQKIRVARIMFFKIRPSREILKIRDGTPLEAGEILTYIKSPRNGSICYFSRKLDVPSNVVQKKRVAQILFFKIRPSREILKICDGTPLKAGEILTYIKSPRNGSVCYFYCKLYVPNNVVQKKRVAPILFFKIRPSQEILRIRDTPSLEAGEILTYIKKPSKRINAISRNFKIRDGTPLEAGEILTYIKSPRNGSVCYFSSKFDVPSNVVQKKRVARIMFIKIRPSREILKIRDGTPLKAGEILTHIKSPRNGSVCYFSSKLDVPSNVVQKIRVARILFFKIRPSREILKIRDGTPLEGVEILTYIKSPRNESICYFSRKLDVPINVVQKKRVARILFFKIRPSREILKIRDGTPLKAGEILTYIKSPRNGSIYYFSRKLDVPSNVVQKKRVARILFFKIRPSREILKIRDGTPLKTGEILTYIKSPRNGSVCYFSSKFDVPSNVVQKKRVARILFFKIRPSREILKIRDGTPLEAGEILTYIKSPRNGSICYFSSKLDVPSNVVQKKRVARILFFKIRPSREILKFVMVPLWSKLDIPSNVVQKKRVARILFFKIRTSREILKIRDGTPLKAGEILTYIKSPRNGSVCYFSSKLDVPSNVVQKIRVAQILFFKIRPSREILKIRDGTPLEAGEILTYIKSPRNGSICYFSSKLDAISRNFKIRDGTPLEAGEILTYVKSPRNGSVCYFSSKLDVPSNVVQKIRVAQILFFKIRPSREILKIRDGTPLEAGEILTYIKSPRNGSICYFSSKLYAISRNFKIRDGTPLEAGEILTYIKSPRNGSVCYFSRKLDVPSNVVQKKRVARILFFKIRPSREILKIRDGTPLKTGEILTYIKSPRNGSVCYFSSKPSREILKIRDGTPFKAGEILTYIKSPRNRSVCYFSSKLDVPSNVVQKKRVARILFFKIRPSREILKIRDDTPLKAGEILTHIKSPRNGSVCYFSSKLDVPSNVVQKIRVARILFFKIRPSREILKIRDGTPLEAGEFLTYIKSPRNGSICYFSRKLDVPSNVVQKKRVAQILFFKIRPSREILKICDGTPLKAGEILTYIKSPRNGSVCYFYSKLYVPSNVVQKKRVAPILFFKIRPSQEILRIRDTPSLEAISRNFKIRDGTPLEAGEILTYIKSPRNGSVCYFSSKFDVPSNVVQKKRVARIMFIKIRPSREILKIRDGTPLKAGEILTHIKSPRNGSVCYFSSKLDVPSNVVQKIRVARILFFKIRPSREILKIRDGTLLEAWEILTYIKSPRNGSICYFSRKLDVPSNVVQKKRLARILFFKIRPSREILKIRDGTPLEAGEILTYIKSPRNGSIYYFSRKLDVPSNVVQKKRVARILFFKIRPSREILKIRDGTPLKTGEILTYIKSPRNGSVCYFSSKFDVPSNVVQKKRVTRILFFKIRPSREILKIRDGTPLEAGEILTYIKIPRDGSICYFSSKLDVPSNVVQKKRVARILFFKIRPSREILKFVMVPLWSKLDIPSNVVQKKRVARILFFKIRTSREILKIRDGTPLKAGEILTYIKSPRNGSVCYFSCKLDVPSNVVQKIRVAQILFFKIRPSREILKIRDGTPLEAGEILTYIKSPRNGSICYFSSKLDAISRNFKIRDGTPLEAGEILTYIKSPRNGSVCYFSSKLDVPSNVVQKIRVAQILFFKIRPSREILKIRDGTPLEAGEILTYIKSPRNGSICYFSSKLDAISRNFKIRDGTPLEAGEILTYIKSPRNGSVCYFSRKLDVPSNVVQKKRVARILFFKIRPSREILKIRDGTPLKTGEILTYIKSPRNGSVCYFSSKFDVPSNVVQKKRVARILFFKIRPSREILKIRDGTPFKAGEILTYIKSPRNGSVCYFSSKLDVPSNVVQKKRVARILFFKIRPSREILKIRDGTPLKAGEILTHIKSPRNGSVCYFSSKLDVPSNVVQKIRVARILFFKIMPSREILKIRDGTPLEAGEILTYIKSPRNGSICYFSRKLDVPSNVVQKKRVAQILFFKIRPSREILKIRDGTPLKAGKILTYIKSPRNGSVCYFYSKLYVPSNVAISRNFKIRDGTPLEAGEILTYIKSPRNGLVCYFSSKFDVPSNVVQKKRVARIMFFKIRPSREILKIRDGTPLKAGEILTHIKSPRNGSVCYFSSKLDVPSNVVQKIRVARILFSKLGHLEKF